MGDVTQIEFTGKGLRDFARLLGAELASALDKRPATEPAPQAEPSAAPVVELDAWVIFDPRRQTKVAAYVDDRQQHRWVPLEDEHGVPKTWRKIYVTRVIP